MPALVPVFVGVPRLSILVVLTYDVPRQSQNHITGDGIPVRHGHEPGKHALWPDSSPDRGRRPRRLRQIERAILPGPRRAGQPRLTHRIKFVGFNTQTKMDWEKELIDSSLILLPMI